MTNTKTLPANNALHHDSRCTCHEQASGLIMAASFALNLIPGGCG